MYDSRSKALAIKYIGLKDIVGRCPFWDVRDPSKDKALYVKGNLEDGVFVEERLCYKTQIQWEPQSGLIEGIWDGNKTDQSYVQKDFWKECGKEFEI